MNSYIGDFCAYVFFLRVPKQFTLLYTNIPFWELSLYYAPENFLFGRVYCFFFTLERLLRVNYTLYYENLVLKTVQYYSFEYTIKI